MHSCTGQNRYDNIRILAGVGVVVFAIVCLVYIQCGSHQFINYDDDVYVTNNSHVASGITSKGIIWAGTSVHAGNWHPVTWLSHMVDVQIYGMNPQGHHLTNIIIHSISTLLLLFLLFRLTGKVWQSSFVAALFALHPLHVESVAWVAERKDLLSAFFWFLTLIVYAEYTKRPRPALYLVCLISFILGLMSKPMLVTLPVIMLLMDFWPIERHRHTTRDNGLHSKTHKTKDLVIEKFPFFACSLLSGAITIYAQHKAGAMSALEQVPVGLRLANALVAYVKYIGKTFWPHDLAVLYPLPPLIPLWQVIASLTILSFITVGTIRSRHRHPYYAVGWFWFLITLVPVIGLIQVGSQSMADRYSYIPMTGLLVMAAWGVPCLVRSLPHRQLIVSFLGVMIILVSAILSFLQLRHWKDSISLYQHTLQVTAGNTFIHYNLGLALSSEGETDASILEYKKALAINPSYSKAHNNLGQAFAAQGDHDAAIREYQKALSLDPKNAAAHGNLGASLAIMGGLDAAIQEFEEALRLEPANAMAHFNFGRALEIKGELDAAIGEYRRGLEIDPGNELAQEYLEAALARKVM